eukprot:Pgem_evm1s11715
MLEDKSTVYEPEKINITHDKKGEKSTVNKLEIVKAENNCVVEDKIINPSTKKSTEENKQMIKECIGDVNEGTAKVNRNIESENNNKKHNEDCQIEKAENIQIISAISANSDNK